MVDVYEGDILIKASPDHEHCNVRLGAKIIGQNAFAKYKSLTSVTLPDSLEVIENMAFLGCLKLNDINIPDNVRKIELCAFHSCEELETMVLPDSIKEISCSCFAGCKKLRSITFKSGNQLYIDFFAFLHCDSLKEIHFKIQNPNNITIDKTSFQNCPKFNVYIPKGTKSNYQQHKILNQYNLVEE